MQHQDVTSLQKAAVVLPEQATRSEILESVARTIQAIGPSTFKTLTNVETTLRYLLRRKAIAGTVLEPVALAAGLTTGKEPATTVGELMDALNLTRADINLLACHCHNGTEMTAATAATRLRAFAKRG